MLDEFRSTSITWDKATRRIYSPVTANASDSNGRKLNIQVVNSGQVENLTGATLHLYWETKDKVHDGLDAFDASDISKGEFEIFYTTGMLSNVGELNATLVLVDSTGKVVSDWFKITVTRGINEGAIESENSFSSLTQALIDISNLEQNYAPRLNDLTAQLQQKANKDEVTNVMTPKGNIAYASLPTTGNEVGWYYYCPDGDGINGKGNYVWNGTSWYFGGTGDEGYSNLKSDLRQIADKTYVPTNILDYANIVEGVIKSEDGAYAFQSGVRKAIKQFYSFDSGFIVEPYERNILIAVLWYSSDNEQSYIGYEAIQNRVRTFTKEECEGRYFRFSFSYVGDEFIPIEMVRQCNVETRKFIRDISDDLDMLKDYVSEIPKDSSITPEKTSFLESTINIHSEKDVIYGYFVADKGVIASDERYGYEVFEVPSGKTIFASFSHPTTGARTFKGALRQIYVKNSSGERVAFDSDVSTCYKYTNDTDGVVYVYCTEYVNHPINVTKELMIQIVDSIDEVVLIPYVKHGYSFSDDIISSVNRDDIDRIEKEIETIRGNSYTVQDYFVDEIEDTENKIRGLCVKPSLVYSVLTDNHLDYNDRSVERNYENLSNIGKICSDIHVDGIVHLGDTVAQSMFGTHGQDDDTIYKYSADYIKAMSKMNKHVYVVNGNHDGIQANSFREARWYMIASAHNDDYVERKETTPYFYVDDKRTKTRSVFIATPDSVNDATPYYGYTSRFLDWFVDEALDLPNGWGVLMFGHIAPFFTWYIGEMGNLADFYGICNAFHNHTSYSGVVKSCDFTGKVGTKMIAYISGHAHGDAVLKAGETVIGKTSTGEPETTTNEMPCPVIVIGCNLYSSGAMSNFNAVAPARKDKTVTQDLWDTMVYRPDLHKIYMIRFGAGEDREIDVP